MQKRRNKILTKNCENARAIKLKKLQETGEQEVSLQKLTKTRAQKFDIFEREGSKYFYKKLQKHVSFKILYF